MPPLFLRVLFCSLYSVYSFFIGLWDFAMFSQCLYLYTCVYICYFVLHLKLYRVSNVVYCWKYFIAFAIHQIPYTVEWTHFITLVTLISYILFRSKQIYKQFFVADFESWVIKKCRAWDISHMLMIHCDVIAPRNWVYELIFWKSNDFSSV